MPELFTEKYFPNSFEDFVGNVEVVDTVRKWAEDWEKNKKGKPLFFYGGNGNGKTCLAQIIARQHDWQFFELNASDFRTKDIVERLAGSASQSMSFSGKHRLVLIDEVDGLQAQDRGGAGAIAKILKETQNPVIVTANDIYSDQKLAPIREACTLLQFRKVNYLSIANRLKEICRKENIVFEDDAIKELAKNSSGDFRAALLDLQGMGMDGRITMKDVKELGFRERQENVFNVLDRIFKAKTTGEVRVAREQSEVENELMLRWVEENIPRIFTQGNDTAFAFDQLSRADVFNGRIFSRQYYGFLRYSTELATSGVVLSRQHDYHGWLKFQFPTLLKKLSRSSALRSFKTALCRKIGSRTHSSSRAVMKEDLAFLMVMFRNPELAARLSAEFGLSEEEIAFLMESKPETAKVKKVFASMQKIREQTISKRAVFPQFSEEEVLEEEKEPVVDKEAHKQTRLF